MTCRLTPFLAIGVMGAAFAASAQQVIDPPPSLPALPVQSKMQPDVPEVRSEPRVMRTEPKAFPEVRDVHKESQEDRKDMKEDRKPPSPALKRERRKERRPERVDGPPPYDGGPDGNPGWQRPMDAPPPPPQGSPQMH